MTLNECLCLPSLSAKIIGNVLPCLAAYSEFQMSLYITLNVKQNKLKLILQVFYLLLNLIVTSTYSHYKIMGY